MKNGKNTHYVSPELDIFAFECTDILTASGETPEYDDGYVPDDNVDYEW